MALNYTPLNEIPKVLLPTETVTRCHQVPHYYQFSLTLTALEQ